MQEYNITAEQPVEYSFVDKRFILSLPIDLRVLIKWHLNNADVELHVQDPTLETCYSMHNTSKMGGLLSIDCPGLGPEEFVLKKAMPGVYNIMVKLFHSSEEQQQQELGTVVNVHVFTRFGTNSQQSMQTTLRLTKRKHNYDVGFVRIVY